MAASGFKLASVRSTVRINFSQDARQTESLGSLRIPTREVWLRNITESCGLFTIVYNGIFYYINLNPCYIMLQAGREKKGG